MTACVAIDRGVTLTYERFVGASGGSGQIFVARPTVRYGAMPLSAGRQVIGKSGDRDIFAHNDPANWLLSAFVEELSSAGYEVVTGAHIPAGVPRGVQPAILVLSVSQSSDPLIVSTTVEIKLEAAVFRDGQPVKTLISGAKDREEGFSRSSEAIGWTLEKTLQHAMQDLIPGIIGGLE